MKYLSSLELEYQYKQGSKDIKRRTKELNNIKNIEAEINKSYMNSMASGMDMVARELHTKVIYNYNSLSEEERSMLTGFQREVVELRMKYKPSEVAERMKKPVDQITHTWNKAIEKLCKIAKQKQKNIPVGLSYQQEQIYELLQQNKTVDEIAKILGKSKQTIRVQRNNIDKIIKMKK